MTKSDVFAVKISVFLGVLLNSKVEIYGRFGGTYCLYCPPCRWKKHKGKFVLVHAI